MATTNSSPDLRPIFLVLSAAIFVFMLVWALEDPTGEQDPESAVSILPRAPIQTATETPQSPRLENPGVPPTPAPTLTVRGRLTWPHWASVPDAIKITFALQNASAASLRTQTDAHGNFSIAGVVPGDWRVSVELFGFQPVAALFTFSAGSSPHILLTLRAATAIRGRVLNALGQPVPGVPVTAIPILPDPSHVGVPMTTQCDAQGNFLLDGARPGSWRILAGSPKAPLGESQEIQLTDQEVSVDLWIQATGRAEATVVSLGTKKGVAQVRVLAQLQKPVGTQGHSVAVATNAQGIAHFAALPPGQYSFSALAGGRIGRIVRATVTLDGIARPHLEIQP